MLVLQSRIIASIGTGERNYHLFYMLAYLPDDEQEVEMKDFIPPSTAPELYSKKIWHTTYLAMNFLLCAQIAIFPNVKDGRNVIEKSLQARQERA